MTSLFSGFLLALFGLSLILITLSLRLLRGTGTTGETYPFGARFFLIALRVAIGWHCFVEGMEKITTPNWSSEVYLRESVGPASGFYRDVAGDRLLARVTVGDDDTFPAELDRDWHNYVNAFADFYKLDEKQVDQAHVILEERKQDALPYFASKREAVTKIAPYQPDLIIEMTMKQRLAEHERLLGKVRAAEAKFPSTDKDVHSEWKSAKADLAKWRSELKKRIDVETTRLKKIEKSERDDLEKSIKELTKKWNKTDDAAESAKLKKEIDAKSDLLKKQALADILTSEQRDIGPMPEPPSVPFASWRMLEFSDFVVKWSLVVLGGALMLGFLSRMTSFATALLIFSFYAAMPPLPGWPESPRLEGHYLLINKTLIEVIALLALAFLPTGRWAGLDGLLGLCCCSNAKTPVTKT